MSIGRRGNVLTARLDVADLDTDGSLSLVSGNNAWRARGLPRYAAIEVGCSDRDTMDVQWLPKHPDAFLLSFEPLLDKYAALLAKGAQRQYGNLKDRATRLGHHDPRAIVLPLAVSPAGGPVRFHVHRTAGCSSMFAHNRSAYWAPWCRPQLGVRHVPSVTLAEAIALVPKRLPIALVKLDAQGADLKLVKAIDPRVLQSRVLKLSMEVRSPRCPPLYEGQEHCYEAIAYMRSIAFANESACPGEGVRGSARLGVGGCEKALRFRSVAPEAAALAARVMSRRGRD